MAHRMAETKHAEQTFPWQQGMAMCSAYSAPVLIALRCYCGSLGGMGAKLACMHAIPTLTCGFTTCQVCRRGLGKALQLLITAGADVAAVGPDGRTPLCWAAARRDPGMVRVLLLAGADTALVGDAFQRAVLQQWQRDLISLRVR